VTPGEPGVARWVVAWTFLLSLAGLGVSTYLTITHFDPQSMLCSTTGAFNCAAVTTSPQSYVFGVPVAILGLAHFVVMTALTSPWAWRSRYRAVHVARFVLAIAAMAFVLWLVSAELLIIDHICEWCTSVHVITFAIFAIMTRVGPNPLGRSRSTAQQ